MPKIFLDTNILIDIQQRRQGQEEFSLKLLSKYQAKEIGISALSIMNFNYICKINDANYLLDFFKYFTVIDLDWEIIKKAKSFKMKDFEDAVQLASCMKCCKTLVTWNKKHFKDAPSRIRIASPKELLD